MKPEVEAVARAMCAFNEIDPDGCVGETAVPNWLAYSKFAHTVIAALDAARGESAGWRDIASAPKDGRTIIGYGTGGWAQETPVRWHVPDEGYIPHFSPVIGRPILGGSLTHWRPSVLPTDATPPETTLPCTLGVGCDESGVCYAAAHDQREQCGAKLPESADERQAAIVARLGPGEFFADGDRFDLVFRPGGGSYSGADVIVGRFACGDTAYWLPGLVAELLNREWRR